MSCARTCVRFLLLLLLLLLLVLSAVEHCIPPATWPNQLLCVFQPGALGGRLDHTLAALNTLYCFPHLDIVLWGERNLVRLLPRGKSVIKPELGMEGPTCGLVPLAAPATASSTGLKWNLNNTQVGTLCCYVSLSELILGQRPFI